MVFKNVLETIRQYRMIGVGDHVVVGVSGGADSLCLLHVLLALRDQWNLRLTVAHLDHMLRGEESRREAAFVRECSERLGVACIVEHRDVRQYRNGAYSSLQEAAREARYAFLINVLKRLNAQRIALGHTADDQAETVLMHLLRGSALEGLSGIPPVRDGIIIRPLINVHRRQIEQYLTRYGISYIADTSIQEQHYLRNKIRHHLLPLLKKEYNPHIVAVLARTASILRYDAALLEEEVAKVIIPPKKCCSDSHVYSIDFLRGIDPHLYPRIIRHMIRAYKGDLRGITSHHIASIVRLFGERGRSKTVWLPGNIICRREYDELLFTKTNDISPRFAYRFETLPERIDLPEIGRSIQLSIQPAPHDLRELVTLPSNYAFIAYEAVRMPLVVRNWQPGDRFRPLGLSGTKKLQDFFSDKKVPRSQRPLVPIVLFQDTIAWVCGYQIDDRFKVQHATKKIVTMQLI